MRTYADFIPAVIERIGKVNGGLQGLDARRPSGRSPGMTSGPSRQLVLSSRDPDAQVRLGAILGLECLEKISPEAIAAAEAALKDPGPEGPERR